MRELKRPVPHLYDNAMASRTPPGVRELKPDNEYTKGIISSRTPPGVRELKLPSLCLLFYIDVVAPLPGCVN